MPPLSRSGNSQSYVRRALSAVELDTVHEESALSRGSGGGPELDKNQILLEADEFVTRYELDEIRDLVRKGALLYHDPEDLARVEDLTREELAALYERTEVKVFATKSMDSYICYMAAVLCASLQQLHLRTSREVLRNPRDTIVLVWLQCAPFLGVILGCILSVSLNQFLGRRKAVCTAAVLALGAAWGKSVLQEWISLKATLGVYLLAGTAMGILMCTVPLYLAETSVASSRGARIANWQLGMTFSSVTLFSQKAQMAANPNFDMDFINGITVCAAFIVLGLILASKAPESPYWCVSNRKMRQAFKSLCYSRKAKIIAARDLYQIYFAGVHATQGCGSSPEHPKSTFRITRLVTDPQLRRMVVASAAIILTRNLSAIQVVRVQFYSLTIPEIGSTFFDAFIASITFALMIICAMRLDKTGRRPLLMVLTLFMFLLIQVPVIRPTSENPVFYSLIAQLFYIVIYQTAEVIYTIYAAEVFPTQYNDMGIAIAMSVNYGSLMMVKVGVASLSRSKFFPSRHQLSIPLFVSLLLAWLVMRETKEVSLEDMGGIFHVPTRNLILYRVKVHLPYAFKRYILWRDVHLKPLEESRYSFAAITLDDTEALSAARQSQSG